MFLEVNPCAFFVLYSVDPLNFTINDVSKANSEKISSFFFSVVNEIHNFLTASVKRWAIFKNNKSNLILKQSSDIRWKSRIDVVQSLWY